MVMVKTLSFWASRERVDMMSIRTREVAVAVQHMIGTSGNSVLKRESCLKAGRKSCPHSLMQ